MDFVARYTLAGMLRRIAMGELHNSVRSMAIGWEIAAGGRLTHRWGCLRGIAVDHVAT